MKTTTTAAHLVALFAIGLMACEGSMNVSAPTLTDTPPAPQTDESNAPTRPVEPTTPDEPEGSSCAEPLGGSPARRLNKDELAFAIEDVYGADASALVALPQEGIFGGFTTVGSGLDSGALFTERYVDAVEALSVDVVATLERTCEPTPGDEGACAVAILSDDLRRLYRRPLTEAERVELAETLTALTTETDFETALRAGVMISLTSSNFLFVRPEQAVEHTRAWSARELATRLSLALWRSVPDDALLAAVDSGALDTEAGLSAQLDRMMADPRFERFLDHVVEGWLGLGKLDQVDLDLEAYGLDETQWLALRADMREETRLFVRHVFAEDRPVAELFTADYTFLNRRLADHYGFDVEVGEDFERVPLPADSMRAGVLTQGAVLARSSSGDHVSVVARGNAALEGFLCVTFPDPPDSIADAVEAQGEAHELSEWDKIQARSANPSCAGCHSSIDPVGWSFASFDGLARWRAEDETGRPIDTNGTYLGRDFQGARGLVDLVLSQGDRRLESCMTSRLLVYASHRVFDVQARDEDSCLVDEIIAASTTEASQTSMRRLVRQIFLSRAFRTQGPEIIEGAIKEEE